MSWRGNAPTCATTSRERGDGDRAHGYPVAHPVRGAPRSSTDPDLDRIDCGIGSGDGGQREGPLSNRGRSPPSRVGIRGQRGGDRVQRSRAGTRHARRTDRVPGGRVRARRRGADEPPDGRPAHALARKRPVGWSCCGRCRSDRTRRRPQPCSSSSAWTWRWVSVRRWSCWPKVCPQRDRRYSASRSL